MNDKLPEGIINRKKQGFSVPLAPWFRKDLKEFVFTNIKGVEEKGLMDSPIKGAKGNLEFLWYIIKGLQ